MRKDVLFFLIACSLIVFNYGYEKVKEVLSRRDRLISMERQIQQINYQMEQLQRLRAENQEILPSITYSILIEKTPPPFCSVTAGQQKREGDLFFVPAQVRCYLPAWNFIGTVVSELRRYPVSITHYTYRNGILTMTVRIYGSRG